MAKKVKEVISRKKYEWLINFDPASWTKEDKEDIKNYEKNLIDNVSEKNKEYWAKVYEDQPTIKFNINYNLLYDKFIENWQNNEQCKFDKSMKNQVDTILYYFCQDPQFFKQKNLTRLKGKKTPEQIPSFNKGLLIVGDYGTGKSSTMRTLQKLLQGTPLVFKFNTVVNLVDQFEYIEKTQKKPFKESLYKGTYYFDDLKLENLANNYGIKVNLMKQVLFERAENKAKTYITCNYKEDKPGDIYALLRELYDLYGPQVHDRIYQHYNIIEFKGLSLRR